MHPVPDRRPREAAPPAAPRNRVLAAMTRGERGLLAGVTQRVDLVGGATLLAPGDPVEHATLPESGLVSLMVELPDGAHAEIGLVGREGLVGLPALLGAPHAPFRAVVRVPGHGHRIPVAALRPLAENSRNLRGLVRRHAMASLVEAALAAACHAAHPLDRRTARWLLRAQDRVGSGVPITQEALAAVLSARRPTVNAVLQGLKAAGLVRHVRGRIAVADRAGLEAAACPCYGAERAEAARLLLPPGGGGGAGPG